MEIYTLNRAGRLAGVVEDMESFIWTERYSAYGDFELVVKSDSVNRDRFKPGQRLVQSESTRVMITNTVDDTLDSEGKRVLNVKGYSAESLMMDKVARSNATTYPYKWTTNLYTPSQNARNFYREIMFEGARTPKDILGEVNVDEVVKPNTIPEPSEIIWWEFESKTVYEAVADICNNYDLGFSITRNHANDQLTFRVYTGYNRTSLQSVNKVVLFSSRLDNLQNTHEIKSDVNFKNVALVYSEDGILEVYATGTDPNVAAANRRVLIVKPEKMAGTPTAAEKTAYLTQKGREALSSCRMTEAFDGEVSQFSPYKYGVDYGLGDLVEYQNEDGAASIMMVTEQIFALDTQGFRSYPTLTLHTFVQPGSWMSWDQNNTWSGMTDQTWNTLP